MKSQNSNISEMSQPGPPPSSSHPTLFREEPIQLITAEDNGLQVNPEALQILKGVDRPMVVVGVAGLYRTGKSYLLNKMILGRETGFKTNGSVNSCTKGIWMWGKPLKYERKGGKIVNVVVLDSEGLAAVDQDKEHDSRVFSLVLLLSSVFVYNGFALRQFGLKKDEESLGGLSLIVNLSNIIRVKEDDDEATEEDYAELMPDFVWVLRDFALELVDSEHSPITPNQYLENALEEREGDDEVTFEKNQIREVIRGCFRNRDCYPLVRPVTQEDQLQVLETLEDYQLRPEFLEAVYDYRKRLFTLGSIKRLGGSELNGNMLGQLIHQFVGKLNGGKVPVVQNIWDYICEENCAKKYEESFEEYMRLMGELRGVLTEEEIRFSHQNCLRVVLESFESECSGWKKEEYKSVLIRRTEEAEKDLQRRNGVNFRREVEETMEEEFQIMEKQMMLSEEGNFEEGVKRLGELERHVIENMAEGPGKREVINEKMGEFLRTLGLKLFDKESRRLQREVGREREGKEREAKERVREKGEREREVAEMKGKVAAEMAEKKGERRRAERAEEKVRKEKERFVREVGVRESKDKELRERFEEEREVGKKELDQVREKLRDWAEKKLREEGDKEREGRLKEQIVEELRKTVTRLKKEIQEEHDARERIEKEKEEEVSNMVLRQQKRENQKEGIIRRLEESVEELEEDNEDMKRVNEILRVKAKQMKEEMERIQNESEEMERQIREEQDRKNLEGELEGGVDAGKLEKLMLRVHELEEQMEEKEHEFEGELQKVELEKELLQQQVEQMNNRVKMLEREREEAVGNYLNLLSAKKRVEGQAEGGAEGEQSEQLERELEGVKRELELEREKRNAQNEEMEENAERLEAELKRKVVEWESDRKSLLEKAENERKEREMERNSQQEEIWNLENLKEQAEGKAEEARRAADDHAEREIAKREQTLNAKLEEMEKQIREERDKHEEEISSLKHQTEEIRANYLQRRTELVEKYDTELLEHIRAHEQETQVHFERMETMQALRQGLQEGLNEVQGTMREMEEKNQVLGGELKRLSEVEKERLVLEEIEKEKRREEEESAENARRELEEENEKQRERLIGQLEDRDEEIQAKGQEVGLLKEEIRGVRRELGEKMGAVQTEWERARQQSTLEKMKIENLVQLKEQDISHLREQVKEKKEANQRLKTETESKLRHLEASKAKLLGSLRKDFEEEKARMRSDFEVKKRSLKEKSSNLSAIITSKDQEIDAHLSNLKMNHKELVKEKEKHTLQLSALEERMSKFSELESALALKSKGLEDARKAMKKKDHDLMLRMKSYLTLKQMQDRNQKFYEEQHEELRKKNEKLNMQLTNIFENSIQNKAEEESVKRNFNKRYEKLVHDMNLKEESFKTKFNTSVKMLEKKKMELGRTKAGLEAEKRALEDKMKDLKRASSDLVTLRAKESRLLERLEQQDKKFLNESEGLKSRHQKDLNYMRGQIEKMASKVDLLEADNKKKQGKLFAVYNQSSTNKRQMEKELQEKTDRLDLLQKRNNLLEKKNASLQTRLQNKSNMMFFGNPSVSSLLKQPSMRDKSGLFSDDIQNSYVTPSTHYTKGRELNLSRIGLTPVKPRQESSSTFDKESDL